MKFIRWLGAFGQGSSLTDAAHWERSQCERQVAAEPLYRGRSLIGHVKIGLSIANPSATFARGWLADAWTVLGHDGLLRKKRSSHSLTNLSPIHPSEKVWQPKTFKNMDQFLAAFNKSHDHIHHAEATFNAPHYDAVVVKSTVTAHGKRRAQRLAARLNLPLKMI